MIKKLFLILILVNSFFAEEITTFDARQEALLKIRNIITQEESIARAYESYILKNYNIPILSNLITADYLGVEFTTNFDTTNFNSISLDNLTLSYALKSDALKNDLKFKDLYENDTFRNRTYFQDNKIYYLLLDDFAKHLYFLIKRQNSAILDCTNLLSKRYCVNNNHIYIYSSDTVKTNATLLLYYHKDKFKMGPFIITNNISEHSNIEFSSIPKGIILYDSDGKKYIKTSTSIMALK
jgi:hypothetical protein